MKYEYEETADLSVHPFGITALNIFFSKYSKCMIIILWVLYKLIDSNSVKTCIYIGTRLANKEVGYSYLQVFKLHGLLNFNRYLWRIMIYLLFISSLSRFRLKKIGKRKVWRKKNHENICSKLINHRPYKQVERKKTWETIWYSESPSRSSTQSISSLMKRVIKLSICCCSQQST